MVLCAWRVRECPLSLYNYLENTMKKFFAIVGMTIGGYLGWWLGDYIGIMSAVLLSAVGTGLGLYIGRWLFERLLD